ncbi:MAG TPA: hypothetical protein VFN53_08650 [Acidobacteriaceae bacterium]|nr:hypothetical protein [Acidobacteriaceae bacterium]
MSRLQTRYNSVIAGLICILLPVGTLRSQKRTGLIPRSHAKARNSNKPAAPETLPVRSVTLPAGLPLRVQVIHRYRIHKGTRVEGFLIDPVYAVDHIVLPAKTKVFGTVSGMRPVRGSTLAWARLNGDFTPLKKPLIHFDGLTVPDGTRIPINADAFERTADLVKMAPAARKQSRFQRIKSSLHRKITGAKQSASGAIHDKHKSDKALQILYNQLPYHPQEIWAGTQFDAELQRPLKLQSPRPILPLPETPPHGHIPPGRMEARLNTALSSKTDQVGAPVTATLTQPYLAPDKHHVVLPEGTKLEGVVTQARPARSFSRNGTLRFTFRKVELPHGITEKVHAQMTAVEGKQGQNLSLDNEGGAHANADKGKYVDPLLLGYLAGSNAVDTNQNQFDAATTSNGFGLPARVLSILFVSGTAISVFAYYSLGQSVTRRWLLRGHEVEFARNTRMELSVADR